ncbi:MAG: zf-HC2 domain-containing protein [Gemmatimonadaceae bacterium]|jgi:anti-sigma factor RsiW|nr:zf-HC2 domain-containing protein [Gemmatimonadaceae bacterium]
MSALDRVVAGLSCREVLHRLSPYLDGELAAADVRQIEAHLGDCDTCARFGGHIGRVVQQLRETLDAGPREESGVMERVREGVMAKVRAATG